jgi:predicted CXXCH cytochrome family protein
VVRIFNRILWMILIGIGLGSTPAPAFHQGGVGACNGCHLMHEDTVALNGQLLLAESPSDLCLVCHAEGFGAVLGSDPLSPPPEKGGGNFTYLFEDNLNDAADGLTNPILGEAAGHSIVAVGHGLSADSRYAFAPGGSFPSDQLGCTSCHDPHGNDHFRMLNGIGSVQDGVATFTNQPPVAKGIDATTGVESQTSHTAYVATMSTWCGNCHGNNYHQTPATGSSFRHPSSRALGSSASQQYNRYNGDASPTGGSPATAYLPEVPFQDSNMTTATTAGPTASSRIMCLSCHRAHGSSAPAALRWDPNVQKLTEDGTVSGSYAIPNPYPGPDQGTLCTKCHQGGPPFGSDLTTPIQVP